MPRSSDELENPDDRASRRRAAASRVAARRGATQTVGRRAARVRAAAESEAVEEEKRVAPPASEDPQSVVRKAPTGISNEKALERRKQTRLIIVGVLVAIGVGSSAAVGLTDEGEIDVLRTIEARNERIRNNQATEQDVLTTTFEVPVQNTNERKVDGGLKGRGTGGVAPVLPPAETASTTASSTDMTASSTEQTASSNDEMTDEEVSEFEESESEVADIDTEAARPSDAPLEGE